MGKTSACADSDEDYGEVLPEQSSFITPTLEEIAPTDGEKEVDETKPEEVPATFSHARSVSKSSIRSRSLSTSSVPNRDPVLEGIKINAIRSSEDTVRSDLDSTMRGIMSNFEQFSSFDPSNLENTLFTSPFKKRPPIPDRIASDETPISRNDEHANELMRRSSLPHHPEGPSSPTGVSNRAASLDVPYQSSTRFGTRTPQRQGQRALPTRQPFTNVFSDLVLTSPVMKPPPDSHRLKMHSRSQASASEPALLGMLGPKTNAVASGSPGTTVRLVSSTDQSVSTGQWRGSVDPNPHSNLPPVPNTQAGSGDDIESRGNELATRCWDEDNTFLAKDRIAEWLGGA